MTIIKCLLCKKKPLLETSILDFMVWPWDCDINIHLNNARFLSFMDLARVHWTTQVGLMPAVFKNKWQGVAAACEMTYIRPLAPFTRFKIHTRLIYWDDYFVYLAQRFISKRDTLHAIAIVKVTLLQKGKKVKVSDAFTFIHQQNTEKPAMPEVLDYWNKMREAKKKKEL
jgi:acyl-CoA thioesterase FadM